MLLAEALAERAEAGRKYEQIRKRIITVAKVQEGDEPPENPDELLAEAHRILDRMETLIRRINKTNNHAAYDSNMSLMDAIASRDTLLKRQKLISDVANEAGARSNRFSRSEVKFVSSLNVTELQRTVDQLSAQYRELDTGIQKKNWATELLK